MNDQWHYVRGGKQVGPVSTPELKQLASSGQLLPTDMVWKDGMPSWAPAETIKGLLGAAIVSEERIRNPELDMKTQIKIFNASYDRMDLERQINDWAQQNS